MADKYVGDLTSATPNLTDKLLGVNGSDAYQALVSDVAKKIIEDYAGTTLMGTAQSIQSAFNGSNSLVGKNNVVGANGRQSWYVLTSGQDLNNAVEFGIYACGTTAVANSLINAPVKPALSGGFKMTVESISGSQGIRQTIIQPFTTVVEGVPVIERTWKRQSGDNGATWSDWIFEPTRTEVNAIVNRTAKNVLPHISNTWTNSGITFTRNADGSVTANGTATASTVSYVVDSNYNSTYATGKTYIVTGCPSEGASSSTFKVAVVRDGGTTVANDYGAGATFTTDATRTYRTQISIYSGTTVDNVTFYPMIRDASIQDDIYVPYGMTNAELTEKIAPLNISSHYYGSDAVGTRTYELESGSTYLVIVSKVNTTVANSNSAFIMVPYAQEGRASLTPLANNPDYVEASLSATTLTLTFKANYMEVHFLKLFV